ncbi:hypothetical protein [Chromobacterium violaceum]|uniref:hypothetical protein n=1 Tax=Chromobacterium violaceum TaxID=536 RepID=UPI0015FE6911|nr:hypothetical protein [Chromobacterium violaceum]MBA8735681.1 hypothetical protein [Chromobacterium violaceum]
MNKILRDRVWVALCVLAMTGCGGGGGGGDNSSPQKEAVADNGVVSPPSKPTVPVAPPVTPLPVQPPVEPELPVIMSGEVDKELQSYMAYGMGDATGPDVDTNSNVDLQVVLSGYEAGALKVLGGKLAAYVFDIPFYPGVQSLQSAQRSLSGLKVKQYLYEASLFKCAIGKCIQSISLQTLADEGYKNAGIGNWKYVGPEQSSGFVLQRVGIGSFVFGKPSVSSVISDLSASDYSGFLQGNPEYRYWNDSFHQLTGTVNVKYDKSTDTVSVSVKDFKYWRGTMGAGINYLVSDAMGLGNGLDGQVITCLAQKLSATNLYGCDFNAPGLSGKLKGKFYGNKGEEFAGTFTMRGLVYNGSFTDGAVGAFVSKKKAN